MPWADSIAVLDPAVAQAIATVSGALAMLIISIASYYFPKGRDRFDDDHDHHYRDDEHRHVHTHDRDHDNSAE